MIFVREERSRGVTILRIEGALRAPANAELRQSVQGLLRRGARKILLDLAGVWYLDAAGIGELVQAYNTTMAAHGVLRIGATSTRAHKLLDRAGLFELLTTDPGRWWLEAV